MYSWKTNQKNVSLLLRFPRQLRFRFWMRQLWQLNLRVLFLPFLQVENLLPDKNTQFIYSPFHLKICNARKTENVVIVQLTSFSVIFFVRFLPSKNDLISLNNPGCFNILTSTKMNYLKVHHYHYKWDTRLTEPNQFFGSRCCFCVGRAQRIDTDVRCAPCTIWELTNKSPRPRLATSKILVTLQPCSVFSLFLASAWLFATSSLFKNSVLLSAKKNLPLKLCYENMTIRVHYFCLRSLLPTTTEHLNCYMKRASGVWNLGKHECTKRTYSALHTL